MPERLEVVAPVPENTAPLPDTGKPALQLVDVFQSEVEVVDPEPPHVVLDALADVPMMTAVAKALRDRNIFFILDF